MDLTKEEPEKLREESKTWTPARWERHLKTVEVPQKEQTLPKNYGLEKFSQENFDELWGNTEGGRQREAKKKKEAERLGEGMDALPFKQRECLRLIFWKKYTLDETAERLGVSKMTVCRWKKDALEKLKFFLKEGP